MDKDLLKVQMMKLWKETFHDSDYYISLVFDTYFFPEFVAYRESNGRLLSAMLAIPYNFVYSEGTTDIEDLLSANFCCDGLVESNTIDNDKGLSLKHNVVSEKHYYSCNKDNKREYAWNSDNSSNDILSDVDTNDVPTLKGLYLCGLATVPEYRGKGLMGDLIEEMNVRAKAMGYSFTCLIPASEGLRKYYSGRGYFTSVYHVMEKYSFSDYLVEKYKKQYCSDCDKCSDVINNKSMIKCDNMYLGCINQSNDILDKCSEKYCGFKYIDLGVIVGHIREYIVKKYFEINSDYLEYILRNIYDKIFEFVAEMFSIIERNYAKQIKGIVLLHSVVDWKSVMFDCLQSNGKVVIQLYGNSFLYNCNIKENFEKYIYDYSYDLNCDELGDVVVDKIREIISIDHISGFACIYNNDEYSISVSHLYCDGRGSQANLWREIIDRYRASSIRLYSYFQDGYSGEVFVKEPLDPTNEGRKLELYERKVKPYAMMRLVNLDQILDFVAKCSPRAKFSILMLLEGHACDSKNECSCIRDVIKIVDRMDVCIDILSNNDKYVKPCNMSLREKEKIEYDARFILSEPFLSDKYVESGDISNASNRDEDERVYGRDSRGDISDNSKIAVEYRNVIIYDVNNGICEKRLVKRLYVITSSDYINASDIFGNSLVNIENGKIYICGSTYLEDVGERLFNVMALGRFESSYENFPQIGVHMCLLLDW